MQKFLEIICYVGVGYDDLTELGQAAKPMAEKIMEVGLAPVDEYYGSESYVTLQPGLYAGQTDLVCLHKWSMKLLLTSKAEPIVLRRKNGSKIITCRSQHTAMAT